MSPTVVMTDAGKAEHNAIKEVFPNARCFLCAFHVAQAVFNKLNSVLPSTAWLDVESLEKGEKQVERKEFTKAKLKYMAMGDVSICLCIYFIYFLDFVC